MDGNTDDGRAEPPVARFVPLPRFDLGRLWWRGAARRPTDNVPGAVEALREALAREETLLGRIRSAIEDHEMLRDESNHRLLNGLQMVVSLLMMQSRAAAPDVAVQLAAA